MWLLGCQKHIPGTHVRNCSQYRQIRPKIKINKMVELISMIFSGEWNKSHHNPLRVMGEV